MSSINNSFYTPTADKHAVLFAPTGNDNIAALVFHVLNWVFFGLCGVVFSVRVYIRFVCFRKLATEDYLMLLALALHSAQTITIQLYVGYMYDVEAVEKGDYSKISSDFLANSKKGFIALGVCVYLTVVGLAIIKLNFLLFFKRLGVGFRSFHIAWWIVTVFTVVGAVVLCGLQEIRCLFGPIDYILGGECVDKSILRRIFVKSIFSVVVDVLSDILILCFPIWILWGSGINRRKKLTLSFVFSLVWVTIAISIVRGTVFHEQYTMAVSGQAVQSQSATFTWFWFHAELSVAFLVACIVSFRSLFVQRAKKGNVLRQEKQQREAAYRSAIRHGRGWRAKWQQLNESVLDKCRTLEDWPGSDAATAHGNGHSLPTAPSGLMTVDFNDDANWKKTAGRVVHMTTTPTVRENADSCPQSRDLQYSQGPAPTGSMHSEEVLLQNPEAVHVRQDE
ncbi:hypothetical protein F5144DRAFT_584051 [Chaetomium tenue]|uniref:Uncharacterized protein n=1 Tax=Chaetomium tenue TaxID=1854479 RepID=A0ACB7P4Y1_9PEZI|nr:hypothetical protein F5144DRAFT_584051 [Chaetomium globosum]